MGIKNNPDLKVAPRCHKFYFRPSPICGKRKHGKNCHHKKIMAKTACFVSPLIRLRKLSSEPSDLSVSIFFLDFFAIFLIKFVLYICDLNIIAENILLSIYFFSYYLHFINFTNFPLYNLLLFLPLHIFRVRYIMDINSSGILSETISIGHNLELANFIKDR